MTLCDTTGFSCTIAGEIPNYVPTDYLDAKEARRMARFSQIAINASHMAVEDAHLNFAKENADRVGVLLGNGCGGFPTIEEGARVLTAKGGMRMSPFFFPMILPNIAAAQGHTEAKVNRKAFGEYIRDQLPSGNRDAAILLSETYWKLYVVPFN